MMYHISFMQECVLLGSTEAKNVAFLECLGRIYGLVACSRSLEYARKGSPCTNMTKWQKNAHQDTSLWTSDESSTLVYVITTSVRKSKRETSWKPKCPRAIWWQASWKSSLMPLNYVGESWVFTPLIGGKPSTTVALIRSWRWEKMLIVTIETMIRPWRWGGLFVDPQLGLRNLSWPQIACERIHASTL